MNALGPPHVVHVLCQDDWGGTEVQIVGQLVHGDRAEIRECVAVLSELGALAERLRAAGVVTASLSGPLGTVGAIVRLTRMLRRKQIDIVSAYGFRAGLVGRFAALAAGGRAMVIGVRGLHFTEAEDPTGPKTRLVLAAERALSPLVDRYDANSRGARDFLIGRGFPAAKCSVIPNAVEATELRVEFVERAQPRIVCVARFVARKRHDVLVRALARVRHTGQNFACELIGYGPTLEPTRILVSELGLDEQVSFSGRLSNRGVTARLAAADVFVLNSLWEGMPGSVLEAMAVGLPVVATDVNGTNEVVLDGATGILVPPSDEQALADAISTLLSDAGLRRQMGDAGRRRAEDEFSFARLVHEKAALYRELDRQPRALRRLRPRPSAVIHQKRPVR